MLLEQIIIKHKCSHIINDTRYREKKRKTKKILEKKRTETKK